jgi:hypothetical protein
MKPKSGCFGTAATPNPERDNHDAAAGNDEAQHGTTMPAIRCCAPAFIPKPARSTLVWGLLCETTGNSSFGPVRGWSRWEFLSSTRYSLDAGTSGGFHLGTYE